MSGQYTLGEKYINSSPKPEVLTSADAGLSLGGAPTNVATPKNIQIGDLATPTSGFGVSTLTKTVASSYKAEAMTTTITTFGPPWLPIVSAPPLWNLFGDLFWKSNCMNRDDQPVMRAFALLEPPVAHVGEGKLGPSPAIRTAPAPDPTSPPWEKAVAALYDADRLVAASTMEEAKNPGKAFNGVHRPTPAARISRPHVAASLNTPAPSKTHSQPRGQLPNQVGPNPAEPTKSVDSTEQPKNTNNAVANKGPKDTVGSTRPVEGSPDPGSQTDGRTPGQAFADTFFKGNPFKPIARKPSQPGPRTGNNGVQTAATSVPGQIDEGNPEPGKGDTSPKAPSDHNSNPRSRSSQPNQISDHHEVAATSSPARTDEETQERGGDETSSNDAETKNTSDQSSDPHSGPSQPDQNSGHDAPTATSNPRQTDADSSKPGRGDTGSENTGVNKPSDHDANAAPGSLQPAQKSGQDEGQANGSSDKGPVDQGNDRPEQSGPDTDTSKIGDSSGRGANVPANPIMNPSIPTNPPGPASQLMVNPGDGYDYTAMTATPVQDPGKEALAPDHVSSQASIGAVTKDASVLVSVESGRILDVGTSKIDLAAPSASQAPMTIGNNVVAPDPQGVKIDDQVIHPGESGVEIPESEGSVVRKPPGATPQATGVVISLGSSGILNIGPSKIDLAIPTAPHAPLTVGNQILAPNPQGFNVNDQLIKPGGPAITVPSAEESIAAKPAVTAPAFLTAAIGSNTVFPTGLAIAGKTIRPGGPEVTISGTGVALDKPGHLIVAGTTIDPINPDDYDDSAKQQVPADAPGIAIAGQTVTPGGPQLTVSGATISLGQSGVLRIGSVTTTLPSPQASDEPLDFTIANNGGTPEVLRATPVPMAGPADMQQAPGDGAGIQIAGNTLNPGSPQVTVSGEAVSLGQSGILRIGSLTTRLVSPQKPDGPIAFTFAGDDGNAKVLNLTPVSRAKPAAGPGLAVAGETLTPGNPRVTVSGQAISLGESGILQVGSLARTLGPQNSAGPLGFTFAGDDGTAEVLNMTPVPLAEPTVAPGIAIAGETLTPGGPQLTIFGEAISLGDSSVLRVGSLTSTLDPEKSASPFAFTLPGDDGYPMVLNVTPVTMAAPTDDPAIAIAGKTLTLGGPQVTISGEAVSLGQSGALRIGSVTTTLGPQISDKPLGFTFAGDGGRAEVFSVTLTSVAAPTDDGDASPAGGGALEGSADRSVRRASWSCVCLLVFVNMFIGI